MPKNIELFTGDGSRQDAHNLNDQSERHSIRKEGKLHSLDDKDLSLFEKFVRDEKIDLLKLPHNIVITEVGQEIYVDKRHRGYNLYSKTISMDQNCVDLTELRWLAAVTYKIIHNGPLLEITYRNPENNVRLITTSSLINFIVLERNTPKGSHQVAFYDPNKVS